MNDTEGLRQQLDAALAALPGDPLAAVVMLLLEFDSKTTQKALAAAIGVNEGTIRRATKRLVEADLIDRPTRGRKYVPNRAAARALQVGANGAAARGKSPRNGAVSPSTCSKELFPSGTPAASQPAAPNEARAIVQRVWDAKDPKPVANFGRLVKCAQRFLDAGWPSRAICDAMIAAPTISDGWIEVWLNRNRKRTLPANDDAARRAQPTGVVQL